MPITFADFFPSMTVMVTFTLTSILLALTPGPDMTYFLGKAVTHGRAGGTVAMLGALSGCVIHSMAVALGLAALLAASTTAFFILKVIGALYLLYLAVQALRHGSALSLPEGKSEKAPLGGIWAKGFLIDILNPKIIVFFVTFLPQFLDAGDPHPAPKLFFLGLWFVIVSIPVCLPLIWSAHAIARKLKSSPKALKAFDVSFAGVLTAFAVKLALTHLK